MSRVRTRELLDQHDLGRKSAEDYVAVIYKTDLAALPPGCDALRAWLDGAGEALTAAIGIAAAPAP